MQGADFTLMHCVSTYPTPEADLNLAMIRTLQRFHPFVGYSGHESSPWPTLAAVVLGACVVERHLTLDRAMYGSDQAASIETTGVLKLVKHVRNLEKAMNSGHWKVYESEEKIKAKLRKI